MGTGLQDLGLAGGLGGGQTREAFAGARRVGWELGLWPPPSMLSLPGGPRELGSQQPPPLQQTP